MALRGVIPSPILGAEGNREFLACFTLKDCINPALD
jgi:hypothetical protein